MTKAFADCLLAARRTSGVSLRELGQYTGLSTAYLHDVEHGRRGPLKPDQIRDVARKLHCKIEPLMAAARKDVVARALARWQEEP